jgi:4-hydroxybutyrate CoA-transferase
MNWQDEYRSRLTTADLAVRAIKSGNRVVVGHNCGEPQYLVKTMVAHKADYENVEITHMLPMGLSEYCLAENTGHFLHNAIFIGATTRDAVNRGRARFTPCFFHELPRLYREVLPVDVALCQLSLPDDKGYCSFGISVDYTKPVAESAKIVIAQFNRHMPRTRGNASIHVSELDYIVEHDEPLITYRSSKQGNPDFVSGIQKLGTYCAELIDDGACLQLGIGEIPDAVLSFLNDKRDLGIHTEMFSDGAIPLIRNGVINGRRKNINKGKVVATFLMGSRKLYDFVNDNPSIEMHPVDYTNDPCVIGQNDNVVAINSCLQIDLLGQITSESIGPVQYSGVGGQVDFIRGASRSKNGKSIIAISSTASDGKYSRIVPSLDKGAVITVSRNEVHYVVTEYGVANLRGKSVRERALALISIAHPAFRERLTRYSKKMTIL